MHMPVDERMKDVLPADWNCLIAPLSGAHILQTWEWGVVKNAYGWESELYVWIDQNDQYLPS